MTYDNCVIYIDIYDKQCYNQYDFPYRTVYTDYP